TVFDFPANFSADAARRLLSIVKNGPRCGVYSVILVDTSQPAPSDLALSELEADATVVSWDGEHFVCETDEFDICTLVLDAPPPAELFHHIVETVGERAVAANKVEVPFSRIAPAREQRWRSDARNGVVAPLGPAGARAIQSLELGSGTAQHAL